MEIWQLLARESIRDLVTRYNSNGDSGRFAQVMELFAPDAVMQLQGGRYEGLAEILTIFTGTKDRLGDAPASAGDAPAYVRHYVATHQIDLIDESNATGRCYFVVLSPIGVDHWGRYIDRYRVVDGEWRFAHRSVTVDGEMPGAVLSARG
jgi:3-phenylpropionate/cinnamic acid dioxygenase small subunit